jgi:hypothetical protein
MITLDYGEDCCRGSEGHTVCGFYNEEDDTCWYKLNDIHGRACANYCANDSCMFCGVRKGHKCVVTLDFIHPDQKRCEDFRPISISKFTR